MARVLFEFDNPLLKDTVKKYNSGEIKGNGLKYLNNYEKKIMEDLLAWTEKSLVQMQKKIKKTTENKKELNKIMGVRSKIAMHRTIIAEEKK